MTEENQQAVDDAPEVVTPEVADNEGAEAQENDAQDENQEADNDGDSVEFPKKAVNALNRKNKQINKLRAQMRELEAKLNEAPTDVKAQTQINPDDFDNYGDYINAQVESLVEQKTQQSQTDLQKQQLEQQKQALQSQRDQHIIEQAQEAAQVFSDLPQVWQSNAQLLDALPKEIADIFYNIDNAPAAVYMLAKEGKLESLLYTGPAIAAYEIVSAQNRGLEMLSKPQQRLSQAPSPISKARGTGSVKKQLSPNDDVLKSLGLKK
jgi:DNA repair exonuclease SbcCD ATPase subunit